MWVAVYVKEYSYAQRIKLKQKGGYDKYSSECTEEPLATKKQWFEGKG